MIENQKIPLDSIVRIGQKTRSETLATRNLRELAYGDRTKHEASENYRLKIELTEKESRLDTLSKIKSSSASIHLNDSTFVCFLKDNEFGSHLRSLSSRDEGVPEDPELGDWKNNEPLDGIRLNWMFNLKYKLGFKAGKRFVAKVKENEKSVRTFTRSLNQLADDPRVWQYTLKEREKLWHYLLEEFASFTQSQFNQFWLTMKHWQEKS